MINTILFIAIIVLMLVLFALLIVILLEYRAKKSYDHYVMQNGIDENLYETPSIPSMQKSGMEKSERSIPDPNRKEFEIKTDTETAPEENLPQKEGGEERGADEPLFRQLTPADGSTEGSSERVDEIRQKHYEPFTHSRLVESMGLSSEEADEFVLELIHQLESAIEELDRKIKEGDFVEIEHITHGLKGAALNIGSGGVADILVDYNTQMKEGSDIETAMAYQDLLRHAVSDLKIEYSQVA